MIRELTNQNDFERNRQFNEELRQRGLCLSVTRTWGNRTLDTNSKEWKSLREQVLRRDNYTCRFCKIRSLKWMTCDHTDGDASNNSFGNLGVNCPVCDLLRHSGRAGLEGKLSVWISDISQIEIVRQTQDYWRKHGTLLRPREIDANARFVAKTSTDFANKLLATNFSELTPEELRYRGFFERSSVAEFQKIIPR